MKEYDVVIIGGGPAGLAAAAAVREAGIENMLILERENFLGGMLNNAVEVGYGKEIFGEEFTGPEFVQRLVDRVKALKIPYELNTMVIDMDKNRVMTKIGEENGVEELEAKAVIIAAGCRERPKGEISIPTKMYAGIYTIGTAQRFINVEGYLPGKEIVIVGSGDTGLIAARRLIIEGAAVRAVLDTSSQSKGSHENIADCLAEFNIPLLLSHAVVDIKGKDRVEGITAARLDVNKRPVKESEEFIPCDTILITAERYPENDLFIKAGVRLNSSLEGPVINDKFETSIHGVFACGDALYIHDAVDDMVKESMKIGRKAAEYVMSTNKNNLQQ